MATVPAPSNEAELAQFLRSMPIYSLEPTRIIESVRLLPSLALHESGFQLAGVLDRLRDQHPERFEQLNEELGRWIPEFDRVLFDTPSECLRAVELRTREGHRIKAADASHGTLLALTMLTIAYNPDSPPIICLEDPERGVHPRLLRNIQDALYRLAYPEAHNEERNPVQIIATTHSPYLLDLFKERPEEIVVAEKTTEGAKFNRLADYENLTDLLRDAHLGDAWYSGILGGVPSDE